MKKFDFESFARYAMLRNLAVNEHGVFFSQRKTDIKKNKYTEALCRLENEGAAHIADLGGGFWQVESGLVFVPKPKDKPKPTRFPKTKLSIYDYAKKSCRELCELPYGASSFAFIDERAFYFTAGVDSAALSALKKCKGSEKKAEKLLAEDADYTVVTEYPFWSNGAGFVSGIRSRLFFWNDGTVIPITDEYANVSNLVLSADRTKLMYCTSSYEVKAPLYSQLMLLDTRTNQATDISPYEKGDVYGYCFVGSSRAAILTTDFTPYGLNSEPALLLKDIAGGSVKTLIDAGIRSYGNSVNFDVHAGRSVGGSMFSDGENVYFVTTDNESARLLRCSAETGETSFVDTQTGAVSEAVLAPDGFYIVAYRGSAGAEIYKLENNGAETQKSRINAHILSEYTVAAPQPMSFVNENGDSIHGFVIPAAGSNPTKRTVLTVHGGPKTVFGATIHHEMQLLSALGYTVIFCNPTGSDGRGGRFGDLRGVYGETDYRDLMTFCDEAAKKFDCVGLDNLAIIGGSYGGFMTNYAIGQTDRFKAAVSQRSISNWTMFFNMSDIGTYFGGDQTGATPWSDLDKMWKQSPIKYADKVKTPTLFIHSDCDYRCPIAEGISMYTALNYHDVPTRLCIFKGENHELSRSGAPKHRVRRLREMAEWLDKYLD